MIGNEATPKRRDLGGDPPCWAHLLDDGDEPAAEAVDEVGARSIQENERSER